MINPILNKIIANSPSELCEIMNRHGSDKGSGHHNYTKVYDILFKDRRGLEINILEIGIGTMNPLIKSSMAGTPGGYNPGSSLRGWNEYFNKSIIYGCDIDRNILFQKDRIKTFYMDQCNEDSVNDCISMNINYDIIIDDGLHYFPVNFKVMTQLYSILNPGGIYVIEDIEHSQYDPNCTTSVFMKSILEKGDSWEYLQIPNPRNTNDNNLFIVHKK